MRVSLTPSPSPAGKGGRQWKLLIILLALISLVFVLSLVLFKFQQKDAKPKPLNLNSSLKDRADSVTTLKFNGETIISNLYVIDGNSQKAALGLSGISDLKNSGMLFYYQSPKSVNFWMKDMKINLDIIWLGCSGKILGWQADAKPSDYPKTYTSPKLNYVLEVEAGFVNRYQLKVGDRLELNLSDGFRCSN
jgi:uncharacterized membrane protein (UPF0127 family)